MNKDYTRSIPKAWRNIAKVYTALGDEHRQRILLTFERGERLNIGQIVDVSTLSRTAVSHHLRILREAGVLSSEKQGKEVYFWIAKDFLVDAMETVVEYVRRNA
jgi:DNA-binding transcriptional ArsR family regulator